MGQNANLAPLLQKKYSQDEPVVLYFAYIPTKDSKLMKSENAHYYNCTVIAPQNRHKSKRNLSLERVQAVNNLKSHISETIWSTEIKFCMAP